MCIRDRFSFLPCRTRVSHTSFFPFSHNAAQHCSAQLSTAQHSSAQPSTAQLSSAQQGTAGVAFPRHHSGCARGGP
eukprot:2347933-Pyramimonas_sp.AAC.1